MKMRPPSSKLMFPNYKKLRAWSKVAGDLQSEVCVSSLRGVGSGVTVLEIGTYCGYTALRMVTALPSVRNTTLEADPIHALIARNMVAFSGTAQTCDDGKGHSKY